jgi:hypothetical protein
MSFPRICEHEELITQCWVNSTMGNKRQRWILLQQLFSHLHRHQNPFLWTPKFSSRTPKALHQNRSSLPYPQSWATQTKRRWHTNAIIALYSLTRTTDQSATASPHDHPSTKTTPTQRRYPTKHAHKYWLTLTQLVLLRKKKERRLC